MGTCVTMEFYDVEIPKDKIPQAAQILTDMDTRIYSWIRQRYSRTGDIRQMLREWRYETEYDVNSNIVITEFTGEKIGDDDLLWRALAPCLKNWSFITLDMEGEHYKWEFDNGQMRKYIGGIVYDQEIY